MSISIAGYSFSGTFSSPSSLKNQSGVYVIVCRRGEDQYLTDVGEAARVRERVEGHERKGCWRERCDGTIRFAALYTPKMQRAERREIEQEIRRAYDPPCGKQ